jgi:hypothetical protein
MRTAVVHWDTILQVVWVSLVAGIGVSAIFSLAILAVARAGESSRAGRGGAAVGFAVLAVLALIVFGAGIALGINVLLSKD